MVASWSTAKIQVTFIGEFMSVRFEPKSRNTTGAVVYIPLFLFVIINKAMAQIKNWNHTSIARLSAFHAEFRGQYWVPSTTIFFLVYWYRLTFSQIKTIPFWVWKILNMFNWSQLCFNNWAKTWHLHENSSKR